MSLPEAGRALRERWVAVAVTILIALVAGGALYLLRPPTYTATLTVYAAPRPTDPATTTADASYQANLLAKERVPSYIQLVTSPQVLSQVIARQRLDESVSGLASRVTATSAADSVLIDIAVQGSSAQEAVGTAETMAQILPTAVDQLEQAGPPGSAPVSLRVIRPIPVPDKPSTPGLGLTLGLALLAGLVLGVAIALIRDALDRSIRDAPGLAAALAAPVLGSLPVGPSRRGPALETERSELGEAYRQLRTALHSAATDRSPGRHARPGVLVVASPASGDGRTSAVVNLAVTAAGSGASVLVVDADLRRPRAARLLAVDTSAGLTDVLSGAAEAASVVRRSPYGVEVLAAGPLPSNPAELLAGGQLDEVFEELAERWDLVLVDVPPVLPVTDAAVVAAAADGVALLARRGVTTADALAGTARTLTGAGARLLGTVLVADPDHRPRVVETADERAPIAPRHRRPARVSVPAGDGDRTTHAATPVPAQLPPAPAPAPAPTTAATQVQPSAPPRPQPTPVRPIARPAPTANGHAPAANGQSPARNPVGPALPEPRPATSGPTRAMANPADPAGPARHRQEPAAGSLLDFAPGPEGGRRRREDPSPNPNPGPNGNQNGDYGTGRVRAGARRSEDRRP